MKNIYHCQLEAGQADLKMKEKMGAACEYYIIMVMMHRQYPLVGERTLPSSLRKNYKNCLK